MKISIMSRVGLSVIAVLGLVATAHAGGIEWGDTQTTFEVPKGELEFLSPEVTPHIPDFQAMYTCGQWLADPDPSWPSNTSSYSNAPYEGTGTSCSYYGTFGYRFQCVEYVQRYFANRWGVTPNIWYGNANQLCSTAPGSVTRIYDAYSLKHGDAIVLNWGTYGHTGIIDYSTSYGCYSVVDQNGSDGGRRTWCASSGAFICGLRAPGN